MDALALLPEVHGVVATQSLDPATTDVPANVELLPALTVVEGRALMRRATLAVVTFNDTEFACGPTVVLDAYALGIPVVSSDTNGSRDYVDDGVTGLLSPPGDPAALAANIAALMDDPGRRAAMGEAMGERCAGALSRAMFEEHLAWFLRAAASGGPYGDLDSTGPTGDG